MRKTQNFVPFRAARELRRVAKLILEEPRKADMDLYLSHYMAGIPARRRPPCGTVGCIAGWLAETSAGYGASGTCRLVFATEKLSSLGMPLTGLSEDGEIRLFFVDEWPMDLQDKIYKLTPNTKAYAKVVVEAIERYIETGFQEEAAE